MTTEEISNFLFVNRDHFPEVCKGDIGQIHERCLALAKEASNYPPHAIHKEIAELKLKLDGTAKK